jgi:hypothetical protein
MIFISYSHKDITHRSALLPALQSVLIDISHFWYDEREIDYGDKFYDDIQQAFDAIKIGMILLNHYFFASEYIQKHELPFLLQQAEIKRVRLAILYVTDAADGALEIPVDVNGQSCQVNMQQYVQPAQGW